MVFVKKDSGKTLLSTDLNTAVQIQRYSSICKALRTSLLPIDSKQLLSEALLATLASQLFNHYQEYYGKASPKPRPITIPSSHLFFDFEQDGSLYVMLSSLLVGATVRDLSPLDKIFDNSPAQILPILHEIDKNLSLYGFTSNPRIFLNTVPVGQIQSLSKIVVEHGGELVSSEDQATHIIDWNDDIDSNDASSSSSTSCLVYEENARAIDFKALNENGDGLYYLIHWPFLPDSANEWVLESTLTTMSLQEQQAAVQGRRSGKKNRYNVACRFLMDLDTFNEWGNESDYEAGAVSALMAAVAAAAAAAAQVDSAADMAVDDPVANSATATPAATSSSARKPAKGGRGRRASNASNANASNANSGNSNANNLNNNSSGSGAAQQTGRSGKDLPLPPLATALYEKFFADILPETLTRSIFLGALDTARVLEIDFNGVKLSTAPVASSSSASSSSSTATIVTAVLPNGGTANNNNANLNNTNNTTLATKESAPPSAVADAPPSSSSSSASKKRKLDDLSGSDRPAALQLSLDRVSEFERRVLSYVIQEHLPQGVTSYLQMRNAIIQLYLQKPTQCLTATECRRKIAGDVARLTRIHEFLDAFGAINGLVAPEARPDLKSHFALQRDMSLSHRRQHLVDRLLHQHPSCVSTVPKPSSLLSKTQQQSGLAQHATHRWTKDMDEHLLSVVRTKSMDWAAISRDMIHWLDNEYLSLNGDKKDTHDKSDDNTKDDKKDVDQSDDKGKKDTAGVVVKQEETTAMDEDETPSDTAASIVDKEEGDLEKVQLSRLSVTQRQALVTPLLCMLRFMELQMSVVVRSPALLAATTPASTSTTASATTTVVPVKTEKDVSSSAVASDNAADTNSNTTTTVSNTASSTVSNSDRAASLFVHPSLLVQHPALLSTSDSTSEVGIVAQKEQSLVSRVAQAVTHLVALDQLLDHDQEIASHASAMDVDTSSHSLSSANDFASATRSLATQLVSQLTQQTTQFLAHLQEKQDTLLKSSLEARLAMLDAKLSLVEEVEEVLHLEREELAHEKRDFYLQRLLHVTTPLGVTLNLPNNLNQPINNFNNNIGSSVNTSFPGSASAANMASLLPTSASSTALASMM